MQSPICLHCLLELSVIVLLQRYPCAQALSAPHPLLIALPTVEVNHPIAALNRRERGIQMYYVLQCRPIVFLECHYSLSCAYAGLLARQPHL